MSRETAHLLTLLDPHGDYRDGGWECVWYNDEGGYYDCADRPRWSNLAPYGLAPLSQNN